MSSGTSLFLIITSLHEKYLLKPNKLPQVHINGNEIGILSKVLSPSHHIMWIHNGINYWVELFC